LELPATSLIAPFLPDIFTPRPYSRATGGVVISRRARPGNMSIGLNELLNGA